MRERLFKIGSVIGLLKVIEQVKTHERYGVGWRLRCQCGKEMVRYTFKINEYVRKNMKPACPKCITWTSGRTISDSHLRNLELDKVNHVEKIRIEQWKKEHP